MAFDQSTRNRLQKFVSSARAILSEEFTRQLQATYGLDPKLGTNAPIKSLTHLDNRQRQTAHLLRETLAHYLATTPGKTEKDRIKQVLDRIVREQAFTVLNRLAALRMAEARGFLLESIAKAHSSKGFQLYRQLSGTAHGETGDAYRNYLFSLFDEFSLDLAVLFDRHSAQGRLFPRESALLELLGEINHVDIEHLWAEDETIGWIYQYFNSQEERKKMRAESQAPRNSRELAVRNQFFTPRYVVEFLTDNTLGRIWYEMTQGNTGLVDSCRYLVRRPTEIFLKQGEDAPETEQNEKALSQQELLQQPVYIPHRQLKDPRTIRMLDPACGSMHFGLYAFDLFERIYLEAWQLEQQLGAAAFTREDGLTSLQETYASLDAFKQQIPKLIIEHNIHGVDIDPRAVQIAGLSLWQRAQRAWYKQGIKPQQRPTIVKSNIVCAEPMPGEKALLQEFTSKLNPPVLGQLLEVIFDKMQLAGEAGTLLKIEEEIQTAIHEAREQWLKQSGSRGTSDLFQAELDAAIPQTTLGFDLRGINDESFWDDAEQRILQALSDYAEQAEATADQKRLFAEDAAKGFAFIDLCRKRFDVVLMNPPFGRGSSKCDYYLKPNYPFGYIDLYTSFIDRGTHMTKHCRGFVGAITSKTYFMLSSFEKWRVSSVLSNCPISLCLDLGSGVLDSAMVETAAVILSGEGSVVQPSVSILDLRSETNKSEAFSKKINDSNNFVVRTLEYFRRIPNSPIVYDLSDEQSDMFHTSKRLSDYCEVRGGNATSDDFRFIRCYWEIPNENIYPNGKRNWRYLSKGGEFSIAYADIHLVLDWTQDGDYLGSFMYESRPRNGYLWGPKSWTSEYMGAPGVFWSLKSQKGISFRALPKDCVMSGKSSMVTTHNIEKNKYLLGVLNTELTYQTARRLSNAFGAYEKGMVGSIPIEIINETKVSELANQLFEFVRDAHSVFDSEHCFSSVLSKCVLEKEDPLKVLQKFLQNNVEQAISCWLEINTHYGSESSELQAAAEDYFSSLRQGLGYDLFISELVGRLFGRWGGLDSDTNLRFSEFEVQAFLPLPEVRFKSDVDGKNMIFEVNESSNQDIVNNMFDIVGRIWGNQGRIFLENMESVLEGRSIRDYLSHPSKFFAYHLNGYSKSRRQAPIYWPLQTPSCSYTLWVYYHNLNEQTLYTCINDFVEPKLEQVAQDLNSLRSNSGRSSQEEKELEKLNDLAIELRDFRDELLRIAKFWKPNLNDGVQITAAPLWKLFQHKAWQKKLKETWESLELGEYDWAHLACSIWPDRVLRKCHQDRSLAIAHNVEEHFWHEVEVQVTRGKKATGETKFEWQPKALSEAELNALVIKLAAERG
jgi:hypothetical protein